MKSSLCVCPSLWDDGKQSHACFVPSSYYLLSFLGNTAPFPSSRSCLCQGAPPPAPPATPGNAVAVLLAVLARHPPPQPPLGRLTAPHPSQPSLQPLMSMRRSRSMYLCSGIWLFQVVLSSESVLTCSSAWQQLMFLFPPLFVMCSLIPFILSACSLVLSFAIFGF